VIANRLAKQEHAQGLILAGTELPLILREATCNIPFLDTTQIHVKGALGAPMVLAKNVHEVRITFGQGTLQICKFCSAILLMRLA